MNTWCFSSFSVSVNNRLSENFFGGITKPKPTQFSGYRAQVELSRFPSSYDGLQSSMVQCYISAA
jgi:hypothetical protein